MRGIARIEIAIADLLGTEDVDQAAKPCPNTNVVDSLCEDVGGLVRCPSVDKDIIPTLESFVTPAYVDAESPFKGLHRFIHAGSKN